ncbi:MAG: HgcAB-like fusion protein [Promethearchaeota archaeon]
MGIRERLRLIIGYLFRWMGYPVEPGIVPIGTPGPSSPVLLTCNFNLTVHRVLKELQGIDCYLLIAPSKGINVWCGACGDDFNTDSVVSILKTSKIDGLVEHRTLILPQLSATGIDPVAVKHRTGWTAKFGPVYAKDIHAYLEQGMTKTPEQSRVAFPLSARLEMGHLYFILLALLLSVIYGVLGLFLSALDIWLYLHSIVILAVIMYGSLTILPSFRGSSGRRKVMLFEVVVLVAIALIDWGLLLNMFYWMWDSGLSFIIGLVVAEDFHGLTPIYKSELGERTWRKGKDRMKFLFGEYVLNPYGTIRIEREKCIGCRICLEVCPRGVYTFNDSDHKADLMFPDICVNCNACVRRCPPHCLDIVDTSLPLPS